MRKHLIRAMAIGARARADRRSERLGQAARDPRGEPLPQGRRGDLAVASCPGTSQAPISAHIDAEIGTIDGSHPPAVKTLNIDFDKTIQVNAKGLPVCTAGQLTARSTADAKKACPDAIVGSGEAEVEVAFPEQAPFAAKGPIVLFNGGVHGGTTLLFVHTYVDVPAPTAVVVTVKITRIHRGHYGIHTVSQIPAIAGGAGSVTKLQAHHRPQIHLQGQEGELPDRQLSDRPLLHRRRHPLQRRLDAERGPRSALHAEGLAACSKLCPPTREPRGCGALGDCRPGPRWRLRRSRQPLSISATLIRRRG